MQAVHDEHREQWAEFANDIYRLFGVQWKTPTTPVYRLNCHGSPFLMARTPGWQRQAAPARVRPRILVGGPPLIAFVGGAPVKSLACVPHCSRQA